MKARKFKVNLKSCAGTFFYSHGVLIFGGLFLFFFVFTMDEIKKYCQPGVYVPCFHFSCLYRSMYSINDTQQTFCGFIFAEIPSKNTFISQLVFLHSDLQNGWFLHMVFEVNRTSEVVTFDPWRSCLGQIQPACCWCSVGSHSPCWAYQVEKRVGCIWDNSAMWRLHFGLLFYRAQSCCTATEESLALAHTGAGPDSSLPCLQTPAQFPSPQLCLTVPPWEPHQLCLQTCICPQPPLLTQPCLLPFLATSNHN